LVRRRILNGDRFKALLGDAKRNHQSKWQPARRFENWRLATGGTILKNLHWAVRVRGEPHPYRPPLETGAIASWLASEVELVLLARPLDWRIAQSGDADAAWQSTFDSSLHKSRCKEGERYGHVDLPHAAPLALGHPFDVRVRQAR
jgi:hypothetical protein